MKKLLLSGIALGMGAVALGQAPAGSWQPPAMTPYQKSVIRYETVQAQAGADLILGAEDVEANSTNPTATLGAAAAVNETVIGGTTYDLQTNSAVARRIVNTVNGDIIATWTRSNEMNGTWSDRGTGYNFYDGSSWGPMPTARLETDRTGWPNPILNGSGETIFAHNTNQDRIEQTDRGALGSGNWTSQGLTALDGQVWSRAVIGGNNGTTIHMVSLTLPIDLMGTLYNGLDGALLYNRSLDGGVTWDIQNLSLPDMDVANYISMGGDNYAMDVQGDVVVIVESTLGYGVTMWKSTDNGDTWNKTPIVTPDVFRFDEEVDFINADFADAMYTSDGSVSVILDGNDDAHVFFGRQFITNGTVNDGLLGFYPFINGIDYWNESFDEFAEPVTIAGALDFDGDGQIGITDQSQLASYRFRGLAGFPQAGIDANGCMYVSYSAVHELLFSGTQNYNHVFVTSSCDGGCTWTEPIDVTSDPANDFSECAFPSIARRVDSKAHILFQKDFEPGYSVAGDMDPSTNNDIVYLDVDATDITSAPIATCPAFISGQTEYCPGATSVLTASCGSAWSWSTGETTQSITIDDTDYGQITCAITTTCGVVNDTLVAVQPGSAPVIQATTSATELCPGDMANISVNAVTGGTYLWSTGATTQDITVLNPGTYTVTVANCGGSSTSSVTIIQPSSVANVTISGQSTICPGQTLTLTANQVTGGSYLWSTGATSLSTTITAPGTYTVTLTNCAPGVSTSSFTVIDEPAPDPMIAVTGNGLTTVCFGDQVILEATGAASFEWSDANSTVGPNLVLTDVQNAQSYSVIGTNLCGVTSSSAPITVTINPLPATPTITFNGTTFSSSANDGNQWYVNGSPISTATGSSWTPNAGEVNDGQSVTVIVTDANGCASEESAPIVFVGLEDVVLFGEHVDVFPNPNNGQFTLRFTNAASGQYTLFLTDVLGKTVANRTVTVNGTQNEDMDFSSLSKGIYYLTIKGKSNEATQKLVIE